jgi:hypothetical protein
MINIVMVVIIDKYNHVFFLFSLFFLFLFPNFSYCD